MGDQARLGSFWLFRNSLKLRCRHRDWWGIEQQLSSSNTSSVRISSYSLFVVVRVTRSRIRMDKLVNDRPASAMEEREACVCSQIIW